MTVFKWQCLNDLEAKIHVALVKLNDADNTISWDVSNVVRFLRKCWNVSGHSCARFYAAVEMIVGWKEVEK